MNKITTNYDDTTHRMPTVVVEREEGIDSNANGDGLTDELDIVDEVGNAYSPGCEGRRARQLPRAMTDPIDVIDGMDGLCYRLQEIIWYIFFVVRRFSNHFWRFPAFSSVLRRFAVFCGILQRFPARWR